MSRSTSFVLVLALASPLFAQEAPPARLSLLDVPFVSQSEALCGGAAAAMVLRYWGERGVDAESFAPLVDRSAAGIRTDVLIADLQRRGWRATGIAGREEIARREIGDGRPVVALIEDRPGTYHYVVVVAWHERGVIFHDPARSPFRVMTGADFQRRWDAADRWMAVVLPPESAAASAAALPAALPAVNSCDAAVAAGVRAAQANQLDVAERVLASALTCPGPAVTRELAGVRLLQQRWPDVADLAGAAIAADPDDAQAWRLLATARFVQNDAAGALAAWNEVGEPRVDLIAVEGLRRTRVRPVEQLLSIRPGEVLSRAALIRGERLLAELPAAARTSVRFVPVGRGLAEVRAAVVERPLLPSGRLALAAVAARAAATRELRVATGSFSGGGESLTASWLFWPDRERLSIGLTAPAPWGGTWSVEATDLVQPFTALFAPAERTMARVGAASWATGFARWNVAAGFDRWPDRLDRVVSGSILLRTYGDRFTARIANDAWFGERPANLASVTVSAVSSVNRRGMVLQAGGGLQAGTDRLAAGLWPAGDTGHARPTLLRAHPLVEDGALRVERLGRSLASASVEAQHWWPMRAGTAVAAAIFVDTARTGRRTDGSTRKDVDAGVGIRLAIPFVPGVFRLDVAKGLTDGATALSFVLQP